jgi:hypothetical protein
LLNYICKENIHTILNSFFRNSSSALSKNPLSSNKEIWIKIFDAKIHHVRAILTQIFELNKRLHITKHAQVKVIAEKIHIQQNAI